MKILNTIKIVALFLLFTISTYAYSQSNLIRFQFQRGAISGEWNGTIYRGEQSFVIRLGQSQSFTLISEDVYTWSLVTPNGEILGCNDSTYCISGDSIYLPMSGDYIVKTDYRMSDCYNCPVSSSRSVKIVFISRN
jgi:hypothetical protein